MPSFHPLKAGRRPKFSNTCLTPNVCFHPLKAGRRHRSGHTGRTNAQRFHPLKAGRRRLQGRRAVSFTKNSFHPLKAGRRHPKMLLPTRPSLGFPSPQGGSETSLSVWRRGFATSVSIPSRRVGDRDIAGQGGAVIGFPSPQGGSETVYPRTELEIELGFPSPQGGSETLRKGEEDFARYRKFPSPQGGSETKGK